MVGSTTERVPCGDTQSFAAVKRSLLAVERMLVDSRYTEKAFAELRESRRILDSIEVK